jgi:hypothetical protein
MSIRNGDIIGDGDDNSDSSNSNSHFGNVSEGGDDDDEDNDANGSNEVGDDNSDDNLNGSNGDDGNFTIPVQIDGSSPTSSSASTSSKLNRTGVSAWEPSGQQTASHYQYPALGSGAIAGIVVGAVSALTVFAGLVWLVLYYRRRLMGKMKNTGSKRSSNSQIDGKFRKAELEAEGPEVRVTGGVHELDATREIQEADGRMRPAELPAGDIDHDRVPADEYGLTGFVWEDWTRI